MSRRAPELPGGGSSRRALHPAGEATRWEGDRTDVFGTSGGGSFGRRDGDVQGQGPEPPPAVTALRAVTRCGRPANARRSPDGLLCSGRHRRQLAQGGERRFLQVRVGAFIDPTTAERGPRGVRRPTGGHRCRRAAAHGESREAGSAGGTLLGVVPDRDHGLRRSDSSQATRSSLHDGVTEARAPQRVFWRATGRIRGRDTSGAGVAIAERNSSVARCPPGPENSATTSAHSVVKVQGAGVIAPTCGAS